jgi:protein gp37
VADRSHIEWTEATWSPLVGCTRVSPGCDHCYAEAEVNRRHAAALSPKTSAKMLEAFPAPFDTVSIRPDRFLLLPLRWAKPRRIFVNSMADLFHADVSDEFIARVFAVMTVTPRHTYQLLTKRPARMRGVLRSADFHGAVAEHVTDIIASTPSSLRRQINVGGEGWAAVAASDGGNLWLPSLPLPNVWLGVSVEDQHWADIRIPALLDTPAAVRWISAEPLLGAFAQSFRQRSSRPSRVAMVNTSGQRVPILDAALSHVAPEWALMSRLGKKAAGRRLDGRTHDAYPTAAGATA